MSSAVLFVLLFSQGVFAQSPVPGRYSDLELQRMASFSKPAAPRKAQREPTQRQREFEERFNQLLFKLGDFADKYNHGHTIDIKKVEAVKKAWRELEKSEPWFELKKSK